MPSYSVANAKASLPRLIDRAMAGEEVVITRHGKPVAELRPAAAKAQVAKAEFYAWLTSRRITPKGDAPNSVELLNLIDDDPDS
jgi:prevent-host-death family protein